MGNVFPENARVFIECKGLIRDEWEMYFRFESVGDYRHLELVSTVTEFV